MDLNAPQITRLQRSIFHRTYDQWQSLIAAFRAGGDPQLTRRANRLVDCCSHGAIFFTDENPPSARLWISRCGDRLCPICSMVRSRRVRDQLFTVLGRCRVARHMVLTLQSEPGNDLQSALRNLHQAFRKLRTFPIWKDKVLGGAYIIEVKRNQERKSWHVHLHILYNGYYFAQQLLASLWLDASRGSIVVWVSPADKRHALYLSKYCGKPVNFSRWTHPEIVTYALATQGLRMVQTFGILHGLTLSDHDRQDRPKPSASKLTLRVLCDMAVAGHLAAKETLRVLCDRWPSLRGLGHGLIDLPPPDQPAIPRSDSERWNEVFDHVTRTLVFDSMPIRLQFRHNEGKIHAQCKFVPRKSDVRPAPLLPGMQPRHA